MRKSKGDVEWRIPNRKTPIAYSTKSTSDLIVYLMKKDDTIESLRNKITYDVEAKAVLDAYIKKGCGKQIASEWFR